MTLLSLFTVALVLAQDTARPPEITPEITRLADSIAAAEFARDSLGSITVAIVSGPSLAWTRSYGFADRARSRPASAATVYRVASITKQVTAVMLLQLVDAGTVRLDDPADRWFAAAGQLVDANGRRHSPTLVQLATMTSGLVRDPDDQRRSQTGDPREWEAALEHGLAHTTFAAPPGTAYQYSNIGYGVLGAALARAAGEPYLSYVERRILGPLGMRSSGFVLTPALEQALAVGVDWDELYRDTLNYEDAATDHRSGVGFRVPGGGLYSTVGDLARLVALEIGHGPAGVLGPEALALRQRVPVASSSTLDYGYGLGIQVYRWGDTTAVGHSGNLAGYTAQVLYDPALKFGVIVLRSAAGGEASAGRLAGRMFRMVRRRTGPPGPGN
ncbi:MAG TPA: serine hydrolase domain-containing protein [Longimicrobium sp.]|jgi:CubicO group peptidase (beta-lactamase class C family)|uniref:serine hydrolase domain-containing protein n=1 Tax=Longimicrobium sp. TaxID=2029185 RepID=UPI002EDAAA4A